MGADTASVNPEPRRTCRISQPTLDEIRGWPATVTVATAAAAFGLSRSKGYELAAQGSFPARLIQVGPRGTRVVTASILAVLTEDS